MEMHEVLVSALVSFYFFLSIRSGWLTVTRSLTTLISVAIFSPGLIMQMSSVGAGLICFRFGPFFPLLMALDSTQYGSSCFKRQQAMLEAL